MTGSKGFKKGEQQMHLAKLADSPTAADIPLGLALAHLKASVRPAVKKGFTIAPGSPDPVRITWAWLLARVFGIDVVRCGVCGSKLSPSSFEIVSDHIVVARILLALGMYARAPARAPPRSDHLFDDIDQRYAETDSQ